ncbi:MAG: phage terminase large subunit family protein [Roseovarius sp.]|nr:phage terminase large subunit family protein [Roseovarius sp.]
MRKTLTVIAPPPRLTISEWADRYRRLSSESSAEPGQWMTKRAEYQRGIMDAISDPRVARVVVMTSAQVGKTEICNNIVGFHVSHDPAPILVVQPTVEMAETWSKDRLSPMIRDTPVLRGKIADARTRDSGNTITHKRFPGGHLTVVGANSAAGLASRPIRIVIADEVDRYPSSAGSEGDPVSLAIKRTTTFWNRKVVLVSTPTVRGVSRIEAAYNESDQRLFMVPCPDCGHEQSLKWAQVKWPEGEPEKAQYVCEECGSLWGDARRWSAISRGEWVAQGEFRGIAGFHLSEIYSPWVRLGETARSFEDSKEAPDRLRTWINTALGETWQESGEAPDWRRLMDRTEVWGKGKVPDAGVILTAGADVQKDRIEVDIWAWGPGMESWLVDHIVVESGPDKPETWAKMTELLGQTWETESGAARSISRMCIDSGYETVAVYNWARSAGSAVLAIKGVAGFARSSPVSGPTDIDISAHGRRMRRAARLWTVSTAVFKQELYRWLRMDRPTEEQKKAGYMDPPGTVHIPSWAGDDWVMQLTSEELVTTRGRNGATKQEWRKMRPRNEALDLRIYARAAAWILGLDRWADDRWQRASGDSIPAKLEPAKESPPPRPADAVPKGNGWVGVRGKWL